MNTPTEKPRTPHMKELLARVEKALVQAGKDARLRAEQTGTPLVVVDTPTDPQNNRVRKDT